MKVLFSSLFILACCLLLNLNAKSQHLVNTNNTINTPSEYYLQVKQFGEFIDRFNYQSDWKGNLIDSSFAKAFPRKDYLHFLLNAEDARFKNVSDSSYIKLCSSFINDVVNPDAPQKISLYSGQVLAKAIVNTTYLGKKENITIYFSPEVLNDRSAKWVISKVETNCFKHIEDSLITYFIAPNSHETSFINLKRIENLSNPIYFFPSILTSDNTIIFMTEIAAKRLTITNIEKVSYSISFPNWLITVEEFNRSSSNSGWLISNINRSVDFEN